MDSRTVAIIGAGISGLITAREFLVYKITPTLFEKSDSVGGLWRHGLWKNFRTDVVKFNCAFTCKSWSKEIDVFPHKDQVLMYIEEFAKENGLYKHIRFQSAVVACEQTEDQKWAVTVSKNGELATQIFDFLIIANGYNSLPRTPSIPGIDTFPGRVIHSMHYNYVDNFPEHYQKVLIVGGNFSGTEIAADIAGHSNLIVKQIICSGQKQPESLSQIASKSFISPIDLVRFSVYNQFVAETEDAWEREDYTRVLSGSVMSHEQGNEFMTIKKAKEAAFRTVNKDYMKYVAENRIRLIKHPIVRIEGEKIHTASGAVLKADMIIFATGYLTDLPFLSDELKGKLGYCQNDQSTPLLLYYNVYNPALKNLGFVGFSKGIFFPMIELQAKYLSSVFAGKVSLPALAQMKMFIDKQQETRILRAKLPILPYENLHHTVDFANVVQASPLTEELRAKYPLVYNVLSSKPFNSCIFNFVGKKANPVRAFAVYEEMLTQYNDKLTPDEHREFLSWIASLDRNFDLLCNLFSGTFSFERVIQDFKSKSSVAVKGVAAFVSEAENYRSYHETVKQITETVPYFQDFQISFDPKQSRLKFALKDLVFLLNFKKNPLYSTDKMEAGEVFANLDVSVNSIGKFTLTLLVKTGNFDQRISTKYKLQEE